MMVDEEGSLKILVIKSSILLVTVNIMMPEFFLFLFGFSQTSSDFVFLITNATFYHTVLEMKVVLLSLFCPILEKIPEY